jgi:hypothetical protein
MVAEVDENSLAVLEVDDGEMQEKLAAVVVVTVRRGLKRCLENIVEATYVSKVYGVAVFRSKVIVVVKMDQ